MISMFESHTPLIAYFWWNFFKVALFTHYYALLAPSFKSGSQKHPKNLTYVNGTPISANLDFRDVCVCLILMLTYALALPTIVHRWSRVIWSPNQMWVNWNIKWEKCPIWVPQAIILLVRIGRHPHLQCLQLPVCVLDPFPELDQDYWKNKIAVRLGKYF